MDQGIEPEIREVDIDELEKRFKEFLYAQKGKVTAERLALLRVLYEHDGHFSVDDILGLLKERGLSVSRATVYRTLDLLDQSGLVRKLALEGQEARYESALNLGHHDHIVCMDCHKIIEFFNPELERIQDEILAQHNLKPVKHIHHLYGSCTLEDCPEKKARQKRFRAL